MAFPGNQYKLLALDLDGTLLNEKNQVSPRDAQAVRRAQERGVRIVLCTGRNVREVRAFSDQLLAPPDWLVTSSGAAVQRPRDAEPQFFSGLSLTHCEDILALCEEFETDPCLYTTQSLYYGGAFRALLRHLEQGGQIVMNEADEGYFYLDSHEKWLKALENEALPFTKAVLYPSHDISDLLISRLKHMGSFEIAPSVMFGGELHNIEINRRGVNKGQGLRWLAKEARMHDGKSGCDRRQRQRSDHAARGWTGHRDGKQQKKRSSDGRCRDRKQHGKRRRTGDRALYSGGKAMKKAVAIGELLIDFVPQQKGCALDEVQQFERVAGGAPANVATAVARLGSEAKMISQVGEDAFGTHILKVLRAANVDISSVFRTDRANTALAFVSLDAAATVSSPSTAIPRPTCSLTKNRSRPKCSKTARSCTSARSIWSIIRCAAHTGAPSSLQSRPEPSFPSTRTSACRSGAVRRTVRRRYGSSCPVRIWSS